MNGTTKKTRKVIVAVHGIGDQVQYATVQATAKQFCRAYGHPETIPLGHFEARDVGGEAAYFPDSPISPCQIGFAEVYWADIPRAVAANGYILEDTKEWARTVAQRASRRRAQLEGKVDYPLVGRVVGEMVESIGVLQDLTFLADKAGIGKFNLNKILVDYVDDVQLVAEFARHRGDILKRFRTILDSVCRYAPDAEIHLVTHSEGTVVALLGMLEAFWTDPTPEWITKVRGFMTFGSPIDKHFVLWPELFRAGYSAFLEDDINLPAFAKRLKQGSDPLSQFICNQLSANTRILLDVYNAGESPPLRQALVDDLNRLIQAGPLDPGLFKGVRASEGTTQLFTKKHPQRPDLVRLNRTRLQDAFPDEIAGKWKPDWNKPPIYQGDKSIKWRNYYDFGDPVGFKLPIVCQWLKEMGVQAFDFDSPDDPGADDPGHDIGFTRYPFPGEAHNEYWTDDAVFDHFIHAVVDPNQPPADLKRFCLWACLVSYLVSYGMILALLIVAVFLMDRSVVAYNTLPLVSGGSTGAAASSTASTGTARNNGDSKSHSASLFSVKHNCDIVGIAVLLAGITVLARLPRLINDRKSGFWNAFALVVFVISGLIYAWLVSAKMQRNIGTLPASLIRSAGLENYLIDPPAKCPILIAVTVLIAMIVGLASSWSSKVWPDWGMKPLLVWGGATVVIVIYLLLGKSANSLWPVAVAGAILLYVWWLAALLFDLVFVWHRYIRHEVANEHWKALVKFTPNAKMQTLTEAP